MAVSWKVYVALALAAILSCSCSAIMWMFVLRGRGDPSEPPKADVPPPPEPPAEQQPAGHQQEPDPPQGPGVASEPASPEGDPGRGRPSSESGVVRPFPDAGAPRPSVCGGGSREHSFSFENMALPDHRPDDEAYMDDRPFAHGAFALESNVCRAPGALAVRNVKTGRYLTNVGENRVKFAPYSDPHSCWRAYNLSCPGSDHTHLASVSEPTKYLNQKRMRLVLGSNPTEGRGYCWRG